MDRGMIEGIKGRKQFIAEDIQRRKKVSSWIIKVMFVVKEI